MTDPPPGVDRRILTRDQYRQAARDDIDPLKHAGESWFSVDEYFPQDISNPYLLGEIPGAGEEYYLGPLWPPKRR